MKVQSIITQLLKQRTTSATDDRITQVLTTIFVFILAVVGFQKLPELQITTEA